MSSNNSNEAVLMFVMWILTIALSVISGILAWNWIEPENFGGAIGFIILWGVLSKVGHFLAFGVIMAIFDR